MVNSTSNVYQTFIVENAINQAFYNRYMNEIELIAEGKNTIENIQILNESLMDSVKNGIKKLLATIAKMWAKFVEGCNTLIKSDKGYLEKYKEIITGKSLPEGDYRMYNYKDGVKILVKATIPDFNYATIKDSLETEEKFLGQHFNKYLVPNSKASFTDQLIARFRGGANEIDLKGNQINMTDVYNYCYGYDKIRDSINKDIESIKKAGNASLEIVAKMERESGAADNTQQSQPNQQEEQKPKNESWFVDEERKYYSYVHETVVNELTTPGNNSTSSTSNSDPSNTTKPDKVNSNIEKDETGKSLNAPKDTVKNNVSDYKEDSERIQRYFTICTQFLNAKLSIAEEIYKEYMQLIKYQVRSHMGEKKVDNTKVKDNGTDYQNASVDDIFNQQNAASANNGENKPNEQPKK